MKISKLVLCIIIAAPLTILNAQDGSDEFDQEEIMRPAPMRAMGGQMHRDRVKGMAKMKKGMMHQKDLDIPETMEEKVIEIIKRNDPTLAEKLAKLEEYNEKKYDLIIAAAVKFLAAAKMSGDVSIEKDVVRGIGLEYDVRTLSITHEKASDAEKAKIKEQIKSKLSELFDIRTKFHELRIKKLESEIAELRKGMETRKANKSKIVEQRLEKLIGNKYLSW